jgi:transcriptional regulator GlxA family with amidase domain
MLSAVAADRKPRRRVAIVAFAGVQALDVVGPAEVFSLADRLASPGYAVEVVAPDADPVSTSSGMRLEPRSAISDCAGALDTLIVAGGLGVLDAERDARLTEWIVAAAKRSRRLASVCTGAFLLAHAGLLDGRRATTHWAWCDELARRHPQIEVERDPIFVRDGDVWTSAGVTAGMDLALALVEDDVGHRAALEVARWLVLFAKRPGGQAQFSAGLAAQLADRSPLRDLQGWIAGHLDENLTVEALADRAGMSTRTFARAFRREVGMTPAAYVEAVRVERAELLLTTTDATVDEVARRCGFGTTETLRRAFGRRLGVNPSDYRARFGALEKEAA